MAGETPLRAGIDTYSLYAVETTYGTAVTPNLHFGIVQTVTPSQRNNLIPMRGFKGTSTGGRNLIKSLGGKFECGVSFEFQPQTFDWLVYVMGGTRTGSGTSGAPYSYPEGDNPASVTIGTALDMGSEDCNMRYLGSVCNSMTLKCAQGEPVSCSLEFMSADLAKSSTLDSAVALSSDDVYVFSGGSLELPDGSAIGSILDSVEITITNNFEILYGLGSRVGQAAKAKQREYGIKATFKLDRIDLLEDFLGGTTGPSTTNPTRIATLALKFTRADSDQVDFVFTGIVIDEWADGLNYGEIVNEEVTWVAEGLTVGEIQS